MQLNIVLPLPLVAISLLIGISSSLLLPTLPSQPWVLALLALALVLLILPLHRLLAMLCVALCGFGLMTFHVNQHQARLLPLNMEAQKLTISGTISSVVEECASSQVNFRFNVSKVDNIYEGWRLPTTVQLRWNKPKRNLHLQPGSQLQLKVKLKRPRNYANPGSFDSERFYFQQRVVAVGYVVEDQENKFLGTSFAYAVEQLRQNILRQIRTSLNEAQFSNIITALVLGIKGRMPESQMQVLQNTGVAHLMSISGLHIGMIASLCFVTLRYLWRYLPQNLLRHFALWPAPWFAAYGALFGSAFYALLAGFSIATQRSLIMVLVFLAGILLKRRVASFHSYCLALTCVLLWDPFAVLSMGFWLSFMAVGFLLFAMRSMTTLKLIRFMRPQLVIAIALFPITLFFFAKASLIGPLANAIAIPWVSFTVVPISIIAVIFLPFSPETAALLWRIAEASFALLWPILEKLAQFPTYNWQLPPQHLWLIIISASIGALWFFMPRGLPGRFWGLITFVPLLFVNSTAIPYGQAEFTLLDVGQGLATVIRTKNHVLVYDTGAKLNESFDLGSRVVAPYLQTKGVKQIDTLMISHADNDHIGGAEGLLQRVQADKVITSDDAVLINYNPSICKAGQDWEWDGVKFSVMHPHEWINNKKRNDQSCVLMIQAGNHKALLTGDIETRSEKQLINLYGSQLRANIMLVPHHGSKTSSSVEFLQYVRPQFALIPVGYKNQYGHPKPQILERYQDLDITILRTELDGAITLRLGTIEPLNPHCYRREQRKFWIN